MVYILVRSNKLEVETWQTFSTQNAKINGERPKIAEMTHSITKLGLRKLVVSEFIPEVHKWAFLHMGSKNIAENHPEWDQMLNF